MVKKYLNTARCLFAFAAGATMLGATMMGAMAADLSSYPDMFVSDGTFNGYMVVGENAKPIDNLALTDIATSMKVSGDGTTTVSVEGDAWKVATSAKKMEMAGNNATAADVDGEQIYDINTYIGKDELNALADGSYKTGEAGYSFNQYLYFDIKNTETNEIVKYAESDDDVSSVFFFVDSGKNIGKYKLEFSSNAESDIYDTTGSASTSGPVLQDFEDTKITILGMEYAIVLARRPAATPEDSIKLTLMGGAVSGTLLEGESQTYQVNGESYEVSLTYTDATYAKFTVNGESSDKLQEGETYKLASGKEIGVSEILYQSYAGGVHSADFFLGASKVVLQDNDITDTASDNEMEVGGETIDGADVIITGTDDNTTFRISTIEINMTAQDDYYVDKDAKLSDAIATVGDDEEILFTNNWDIEYKGLSDADTHELGLASTTDRKYKLIWYDGDGNKVDMPLYYATNSSHIQFSEESASKCLSLYETTEIQKNDYFVLTGGSAADGTGVSYALQYKGAAKSTSTSPKIKFKNIATGESLEYSINTETTTDVVATIKIGGYSFNVENNSVKTAKDFSIQVDQDGSAASPAVAPIDIIDYYGASFDFGGASAANRCAANNVTSDAFIVETENTNDYDNYKPELITVTADATTTNEVTISTFDIGGAGDLTTTPEGEENIGYAYTSMGAKITYATPSSSPNLFTYEYPSEQRLPLVYVTSGATTTTSATTGDLVAVTVVDATKLDSEIASTDAQNLMVVGGPCVNSIAAELMGNPADCAEGFTPGKAIVKLFEHSNGNVAMLVAGYSGADTRLAGKVIAHRWTELSGEEVEIEGTTYSDATIGAPASE